MLLINLKLSKKRNRIHHNQHFNYNNNNNLNRIINNNKKYNNKQINSNKLHLIQNMEEYFKLMMDFHKQIINNNKLILNKLNPHSRDNQLIYKKLHNLLQK